jgi:hypothetical protein
MFFESTEGTEASQPPSLFETAKKATKSITDSFNPKSILDNVYSINQRVSEMVRTNMGQSESMIRGLEKNITKATQETLKFGVGAEENIKLYGALNDIFRTNVLLSDEQVVNMQAIATSAGITQEEMATIVEGFETMGTSTVMALKHMEMMNKQARLYGINTGQFMDVVAANIKKLAMFDFKNGVEGFSRMVAQAQTLRIDVEKTFQIAEGLLEPEKAIEMAATFSTLGGSFAKIADPFKLMNMAQNDVEELQNTIVNAAAATATFNEETGKFSISRAHMYELRRAADALNMSGQEMTEMAIKQAEVTRNQDLLKNMMGFTEEQRNLLANIAQVGEDGRLKLSIDGNLVDLQTQSAKVIEELEKVQKEAKEESKSVAEEQLGVLNSILSNIKSGAFQTTVNVMMSDQFDKYNENLETLTSETSKLLARETGKIKVDEILSTALPTLNDALAQLIAWLRADRTGAAPTIPGSAEGGVVTSPATVYVGEYMNAKTNPEVIAPLDKLTEILAEVMPVKSNVEKIDVNLNSDNTKQTPHQDNKLEMTGGFEVNLKLNERNLPNINTDELAKRLLENPVFMAKIFNGKPNNTYRGI